jgi:predicted site-specific integrase-resolvase
MKATPRELLSANRLSKIVNITPATLLAWARAGKIPVAAQMEKTWRFDVAEVLAALKFTPTATKRGLRHE